MQIILFGWPPMSIGWPPMDPLKLISRSRVDLKNGGSQEVHLGEAGVDALLAAQVDMYVVQLCLSSVGWSRERSFNNKYCVIFEYTSMIITIICSQITQITVTMFK
jgi:hypothetical protein